MIEGTGIATLTQILEKIAAITEDSVLDERVRGSSTELVQSIGFAQIFMFAFYYSIWFHWILHMQVETQL